VAVFVPAGLYSSLVSVDAANAAAMAANEPRLDNQLNCSAIVCAAIAGVAIGLVKGFNRICAGGYWFNEPISGLGDGVVVNEQYA
jgi:uncharacterized protein YsxB (DUF464 family)